MTIIETLRDIRKYELGLSQQTLSEKLHINQNTLSNYEGLKLETFSHIELVERMNSVIFNKTGIYMDFYFELCSDGNLDLYFKHKFSKEDIEKLRELDWIDYYSEDLEDCSFEENGAIDNPFELFNDSLELPNNLFWFILEETFGKGADVVGVYDLDEYVQLNISIPV